MSNYQKLSLYNQYSPISSNTASICFVYFSIILLHPLFYFFNSYISRSIALFSSFCSFSFPLKLLPNISIIGFVVSSRKSFSRSILVFIDSSSFFNSPTILKYYFRLLPTSKARSYAKKMQTWTNLTWEVALLGMFRIWFNSSKGI